jgi:3-demethoxyubiquinol 3-hydroxylase
VRAFAERHLATELRHLALMEELLPRARRSRLLRLWKAAGYVTGALPSLFGANAVYATIDAVESFVDEHYAEQISALAPYSEWHDLRGLLAGCRADEIEHRNDARQSLTVEKGLFARIWVRLVALGSAGGVSVARIV